jgi:hypothetical protein
MFVETKGYWTVTVWSGTRGGATRVTVLVDSTRATVLVDVTMMVLGSVLVYVPVTGEPTGVKLLLCWYHFVVVLTMVEVMTLSKVRISEDRIERSGNILWIWKRNQWLRCATMEEYREQGFFRYW